MELARGALFDLDGTLVDNMRYHVSAWLEVTARHGLRVPRARFEHEFAGKKNDEILRTLFGDDLAPARIEAISADKEETYRALYRPHLAWHRGVAAFVARLRARGVRCAVATAAPRENREMVLEGLGAVDWFDAVVGAERVTRGKPAPDIFLAAAAAIGVTPSDCVVFEDALNGVRAAVAASMRPVGVATVASEAALIEAGARVAIADFEALPRPLLEWFGLTD